MFAKMIIFFIIINQISMNKNRFLKTLDLYRAWEMGNGKIKYARVYVYNVLDLSDCNRVRMFDRWVKDVGSISFSYVRWRSLTNPSLTSVIMKIQNTEKGNIYCASH